MDDQRIADFSVFARNFIVRNWIYDMKKYIGYPK